MLRIFNCPHCQGVFKAELEDGVSHLQCPHCEREIEVSTLAAETHEPQSGEQASSESTADVEATTKPKSESGKKPRMKVSESEVKRSILPPGFKDKVQNKVQDAGHTDSANDEQEEDSTTEDLKSELAIPMPVSPEPESEVAESAEEQNSAKCEKESVENGGDDTDDDSAEDLVLPAVLENAAVIQPADQMLGDLASEASPTSQSVGIHVIETDEEEEALIERVVKDRQQYKRRKNIVMWFLGFVIIALTLMLLIR